MGAAGDGCARRGSPKGIWSLAAALRRHRNADLRFSAEAAGARQRSHAPCQSDATITASWAFARRQMIRRPPEIRRRRIYAEDIVLAAAALVAIVVFVVVFFIVAG
jgi:hypothetical protein